MQWHGSLSWWDWVYNMIQSHSMHKNLRWPIGYTYNFFYSSWTHSSPPLSSNTLTQSTSGSSSWSWFCVLVLGLGLGLGHGWVVTEWMVTVSLWAQSIKGRLRVVTCQHIPQGQWILRSLVALRVLHCIVCPCRSLLFFSLRSSACLQEIWCQ